MWPWVLDAVGAFSLLLISKHYRAGFLVGVLTMCLWAVYAVDTSQLGFLPGVVLYSGVHVRGWVCWGKRQRSSSCVGARNR